MIVELKDLSKEELIEMLKKAMDRIGNLIDENKRLRGENK